MNASFKPRLEELEDRRSPASMYGSASQLVVAAPPPATAPTLVARDAEPAACKCKCPVTIIIFTDDEVEPVKP